MYNVIDEYIAGFDPEIQEKLNDIRDIIKTAAPDAIVKISWGMATLHQHYNLVHFAGQKYHVGFYPGASGVEKFSDRLSAYKTSKGAIQFPYEKPMPHELITEIVKFRINENIETAKEKGKIK